MKLRLTAVLTALTCVVAAASSAQATGYTTYKAIWSGALYGNSASAVGYFVVSDSAFTTHWNTYDVSSSDVPSVTVTVSGASYGNGTFGTADFNFFGFWAPSALDLSKNLIGQQLSNGCLYGVEQGGCNSWSNGTFYLESDPVWYPMAPTGIGPFDLGAAYGTGDKLAILSITQVGVPEPATWAMLTLGVAMIGFAARRRNAGAALAA